MQSSQPRLLSVVLKIAGSCQLLSKGVNFGRTEAVDANCWLQTLSSLIPRG